MFVGACAMSMRQLLRRHGRATLRVTAAEAPPAVFDALILFAGGRAAPSSRRLRGEATPFMLDLPDEDVTVVVQPRDPGRRLIAEYEREVSGRRVLFGRSWMPTPVLHRRRGGIVCTGLSASDETAGPNGSGSLSPVG